MSVISQCRTLSSSARELDAFQAEVDAIGAEFVQELTDLVASPDAVTANAMADAAFVAANVMLSGSLDTAMTNAGISKPNESFEESRSHMMNAGYLFTGTRAWFCSTPTWRMHRVDGNTMYKALGVGDGEYSPAALKSILLDYREPDYKDILRGMKRRPLSATGASDVNGASASQIGPVYAGNIAALREAYIGCGSSQSRLREVLTQIKSQGWGVIWSMPQCRSVLRPLDVSVPEFTATRAQTLAGTTVRESDVVRVSDDEYIVLTETHVASNCSRERAWAAGVTAQLFPRSWDRSKLICRLVSACGNELVRDQAPVFVSKGFSDSGFGPGACFLGVVAQGIARVIDVTNDDGYHACADKYTASGVALAIRNVFPDLLETGVIGDEWYVTTKSSGADASFGFFVVDQRDASQASGLTGGIAAAQNLEFSATSISSIEFAGGATVTGEFPQGLLRALASLELSDTQRNAVLTDPRNYWTQSATEFDYWVTQQQQAVDAKASGFSESEHLMPITGFMFLEDFRCAEAAQILDVLGADADMVFRQTDVIAMDLYTEAATVRNTLRADIERLTNGTGIQASATYGLTISPRESNYKQASTLYMLAWIADDFQDRGDEAVQSEFQSRLDNTIAGVQFVDYAMATMTSGATEFVSLSRLADDYTAMLNRWPSTANEILETAASELAALTTSFLKKNFPEEYRKFTNSIQDIASAVGGAMDDAGAEVSDALDTVRDLERAFASSQSEGLRQLQSANAVLVSITPVVYAYANAYQTTYKKLASLTSLNLNIFKSAGTGISTKFISCYASGEASFAVSLYLTKFLDLLNAAAAAINKILESIIAAIQKLITKIACILNGIKAAASGLISYSSSYPIGGGVVSLNVTCSVSTGISVDPEILANLAQICDQVTAMLGMFRIHLTTFSVQSQSTDELTKQAQNQLVSKLMDSLNNLLACF